MIGNLLSLCCCLLLIEGLGQTYAFLHPSYRVLYMQPDKVLGWKGVPGLHWTWAGHYWYARDFSVSNVTNSLGFRDKERKPLKLPGIIRAALLGDSLVEAATVPLEKSAGALLEKSTGYEVLNFGVSAFGLGQCYLAWREYASKFKPDYIFIFVAGFHMTRTVTKYEGGAISNTPEQLWIRPSFRLEQGRLVLESPRDLAAFAKAQEELLAGPFKGRRMLRRRHGLFLADYISPTGWYSRLYHSRRTTMAVRRLRRLFLGEKPPPADSLEISEETLAINLKILETLNEEVSKTGARLIVVDASRYFNPTSTTLAARLQEFSAAKNLGYIPLYQDLMAANGRGLITRWQYDGHFNDAGNEMFAEAMRRWLKQTRKMP